MTIADGYASKYCVGCARKLHVTARACPGCGAPQGRMVGSKEPKSRTITVILALLLGGIGGHQFYLGRPGLGFIYLLFCWSFIPAIVAFVEAIIYLCMGDETFAEKQGFNN